MAIFLQGPPNCGKIAIFDKYLALGSMTGGVSSHTSVVNNFDRAWSKFITPSVGLRLAADGHAETQRTDESSHKSRVVFCT